MPDFSLTEGGTTSVPTLNWLDRWDEQKGEGTVTVVGSMVHTQELRGEDTITFSCLEAVEKGDRLIWDDPLDGVTREHVAVRVSYRMRGLVTVYAESSLCDLLGDYVYDTYVHDATAGDALRAIVRQARYSANYTPSGGKVATCYFYHMNALAAIRKLEEVWGCVAYIRVSWSHNALGRFLCLELDEPVDRGASFAYSKNVVGATRTVLEDEVCTALYGYGAGLPATDEDGKWTGGYHRKLTFADVNGGVPWVGDDDAKEVWGLYRFGSFPLRLMHRFGDVTFSDCEDPDELLELTKAELAKRCSPQVSYVVDGVLIDGAEDVRLGDVVSVLDTAGEIPWDAKARVKRLVRTYGVGVRVRATLGAQMPTAYAKGAAASASVSEVELQSAAVATTVSSAVTGSAGGETPEEEEAELAARALLWDDGTLEFTYVKSTASQSGGTVSMAYSVPESSSSFSDIPWRSKAGSITGVIFHSSFADAGITSLAYWFYTCQKLTSFTGLGYLQGVTSLRYALSSCTSLTSLALGSMTLADSADLYMAFGGDKALTTITVDASWTLPTLSSGYQTFYNCTSLVGGNGTKYASSKAGGAYMVIDAEGTPGYLTAG